MTKRYLVVRDFISTTFGNVDSGSKLELSDVKAQAYLAAGLIEELPVEVKPAPPKSPTSSPTKKTSKTKVLETKVVENADIESSDSKKSPSD